MRNFLIILFLFISLIPGCSLLPPNEKIYTADGKQIVMRKKGIDVQVLQEITYWDVFYVNKTNKPKCVEITWRYFDLIRKFNPSIVYVDANDISYVGYFQEQEWEFDKVQVYVGGSGHIDRFNITKPLKGRVDCISDELQSN